MQVECPDVRANIVWQRMACSVNANHPGNARSIWVHERPKLRLSVLHMSAQQLRPFRHANSEPVWL